jgi:hypothetical protein
MKRRVCSYDMFAVPDPSFVLKDTVGEMYLGSPQERDRNVRLGEVNSHKSLVISKTIVRKALSLVRAEGFYSSG